MGFSITASVPYLATIGSSADPLYGKKVNRFDFTALVQAFHEARAADAMLTRWNAMHKLLDAHLAASNT